MAPTAHGSIPSMPALRNMLYALAVPILLAAGCYGDRHCRSSDLPLLPHPQEVMPLDGRYIPPDTVKVRVSGMDEESDPVLFGQLEEITEILHTRGIPCVMPDDPDIWIGLPGSDASFRAVCGREGILPDESLGEEGYVLKINGDRILLSGNSRQGVFYGVQTLRQLSRAFPGKSGLPALRINDWPEIPVRAVMDDISRGPVPTKQYIKEQIRRYAELKINSMSFYIEHVVRTEKYPGFAPRDGALTIEEFRELSDYAADYHISLIGNFQSLGHAEKVLAVPGFRHLGATDRMYDPFNPETVKFLRDIYREMAPAFSSGWFTPNCDEACDLSRAGLSGKAPRLLAGVAFESPILRNTFFPIHDESSM